MIGERMATPDGQMIETKHCKSCRDELGIVLYSPSGRKYWRTYYRCVNRGCWVFDRLIPSESYWAAFKRWWGRLNFPNQSEIIKDG